MSGLTRGQVRQVNAALNTLDDLSRAIFVRSTQKAELAFGFGGNNKRPLNEAQTAIVYRALYDDAANTIQALGIVI